MFTVIVTLDVRTESIGEFVDVIRENARLSVEREEGCLSFDVTVSTENPGRFYFYEKYTDAAAFYEAHRRADHYENFIARSTPLIIPGSKVVACATELPAESKQ